LNLCLISKENDRKYEFNIPWTPLQYAAALGNQVISTFHSLEKEMVTYLIQKGADANITDKTGKNAQQIANYLKKNIEIYATAKLKFIHFFHKGKLLDVHFNI
jgi:ankyrin repeat protein